MQKGNIMPMVLFIGLAAATVGIYIWYVYAPVLDTSFLPERQEAEDTFSHWQRKADMPTARTEVSGAVLNGQIYVIGGISGTARTLATVEAYDPESDTWSRAADLPQGVHHAATVSYQGKLYVTGGFRGIGSVAQDSVYVYDPETDKWTSGESMPEKRGAHGAAVIGDYMYVVGGVTGQGLSSDLLRFDFKAGTWEFLPPMQIARDHLAVAAVGNQLLVAGGRRQSLRKNLAVLEVFTVLPEGSEFDDDEEAAFGTWATGPNMSTARGGVTGVRLGSALVVAGGERPMGTFSDVEAFDVRTQSWHAFPSLNFSRHGAASAVVGDTLYVIGGGRRPGLSVSRITEALDVRVR